MQQSRVPALFQQFDVLVVEKPKTQVEKGIFAMVLQGSTKNPSFYISSHISKEV
jgi:hypothetical protein